MTKSYSPQQCEVDLPAIARRRSKIQSEVHPLKARFVVLAPISADEVNLAADDGNQARDRSIVIGSAAPFFLTRVQKREPKSMMRFLLNSGPNQSSKSNGTNTSIAESDDGNNRNQEVNSTMWVPYLKFGRSPIRIRFDVSKICFKSYLKNS